MLYRYRSNIESYIEKIPFLILVNEFLLSLDSETHFGVNNVLNIHHTSAKNLSEQKRAGWRLIAFG